MVGMVEPPLPLSVKVQPQSNLAHSIQDHSFGYIQHSIKTEK